MTNKLIPLALGFSIGVNIILALEVARLRRAIWDTTRRINYLGRMLSSHAAGRNGHAAGEHRIERLP